MGKRTIDELRRAKGWSQVDLAGAIGVTEQTVQNWERGRSEPRASKLLRMAEEFDVDPREIAFTVIDTQQGRRRPKAAGGEDA